MSSGKLPGHPERGIALAIEDAGNEVGSEVAAGLAREVEVASLMASEALRLPRTESFGLGRRWSHPPELASRKVRRLAS